MGPCRQGGDENFGKEWGRFFLLEQAFSVGVFIIRIENLAKNRFFWWPKSVKQKTGPKFGVQKTLVQYLASTPSAVARLSGARFLRHDLPHRTIPKRNHQ